MAQLDSEYILFKSLCHLNKIIASEKNQHWVNNLITKGIKIDHKGKYFFLDDNIIPLSEVKIRSGLSSQINQLIESFTVIYETSSTNKRIHSTISGSNYSILITEAQTDGQGRRGKKWISPLARNIYLSIKFSHNESKNIPFLPLITALCLCKSLKSSGIKDCQIKWPNDIYLHGKKIAGILVESCYKANKSSIFTVGIGLNVNMNQNDQIDQDWSSMQISKKNTFDRNKILSVLLTQFVTTYNEIDQMDFELFKNDWKEYDYLFGLNVKIISEKKISTGIAQGIADDGALLVTFHGEKKQRKIYSADVSIKL